MTEEGGVLVQVMAFASAGLSAIAAIAAISSAHWARRQAIAAEAALARKRPVITCEIHAIEDQPEWIRLSVRMRNPSEVPVILLRATIARPPEWRMLNSTAATFHDDDGNHRPVNPLPADRARRSDVEIGVEADGIDSLPQPGRGHSADTAYVDVFVHRRPLTIRSYALRLFSSLSRSRRSRSSRKLAYFMKMEAALELVWVVSYTDDIDREIEISQKVNIASHTH